MTDITAKRRYEPRRGARSMTAWTYEYSHSSRSAFPAEPFPWRGKGFVQQIDLLDDGQMRVWLKTWRWHDADDGFSGMLFKSWEEVHPFDQVAPEFGWATVHDDDGNAIGIEETT